MTRTLVNQLTIVLDEKKYSISLHRPAYRTAGEFADAVAEVVRNTITAHYNEKNEEE